MKYLKVLAILIAASSFLSSCKSSKNKELTVPKSASTVIHINGASVSSKADWNELMQADWFSRQINATDSFHKQIMEHPEQSGIDLKSDFIYFTQKKDFVTYSVFEGKLKNASDFEKLVKEKNGDRKVETSGGFNFIQTGNSDLVSWTNSKFIYVSTEQSFGRSNLTVSIDSLKNYANALFDLKNNNSIESNENYASLLKEKGDIHFWSNTADAFSNFDFGPFPLIAASPLIQGSITAGSINFENGKIVVQSKQYLNQTVSQLIQKYPAKTLTSELLNHVSPDASVVIAMNFHPQLIKDFLRASGTESSVNRSFEDLDLTADELLQWLNGEILVTASQLGPQKISMEDMDDMDENGFPLGGNLLLAASVNNDSSFKKIKSIIGLQFPSAPVKLENNWFLTGSSAATVNQFFSATTNNLVSKKLGGHPLGIYLDIQKGLQQWDVSEADSSLIRQFDLSKKFWQDFVSTGGEFKDGSLHFETTINLVDQSTNSLKQLARYGMQMAAFTQKGDFVKNKTQKKTFLAYNF